MVLRVAQIVVSLSLVDLEEEEERESCGRRMELMFWRGLEKPVVERKRFLRGFKSMSDCACCISPYCLPEQLISEQNYIKSALINICNTPDIQNSPFLPGFRIALLACITHPNYNLKMLNNFRPIIQNCIRSISSISRISPATWAPPTSFKSLRRVWHFDFCSKIDYLKNSEKTFELLVGKLKEKVDYCEQLEQELMTQASQGQKNKEQIRIELSQLAPLRTAYEEIKSHQDNIAQIQEMMGETKDAAQKKLLDEQLQVSRDKLNEIKEELWELLIPAAKYDHSTDIILQFRPGAGGAESSIFVKDISQMYQAFCGMQGWKCWVTASAKESGVSAGYKFLDMRVQGEGAHKILKTQAGVHKVIRVPETEAKGRLHSSTISMVVMPVVPFSFEVDPKDIKYQFTRSSGPGGQAVNKIQSACRATHIPTGLQVFIQEQRSQEMNKKRATDLLKQRLFEIEYRKSVEEEQSRRKSQVTTLDRSEKIRTYNYPQDRITDHRTGLTKFGIRAMMNGELLQQFYESFNQNVKEEKIQALIEELYQEAGIPVPKK